MRTLLAALLSTFALTAAAQAPLRDGGFVVYYAAMSSLDLPAATVTGLGLQPDAHRALLLINVQRDGAPGHPVTASATGIARSLNGPEETLTFRVTRDGDLIAPLQVIDREHVTFDVQVTPAGATRAIAVKFAQQFFTD